MTSPAVSDPRRARLFAWTAAGLGVVAHIGSLVLEQDNGVPPAFSGYALRVAFAMYLIVGFVLLWRRPENRLGWLLTGVGLVPALGLTLQEYARLALVERPGLPGGVAAAWLNQLWWFATLAALFIFVPLLFPTGRLPSPRWRWLARTVVAVISLVVLMEAFGPDLSGQDSYEITNPLAAHWVQDLEEGVAGGVLFAAIGLCMVATIVSVVVRFRRSTGIERQQMKWFVFAALMVVGLPLLELMSIETAGGALFDLSMSFIPIAIGDAVLRYRLYDIDRLVSRTVTYALLSAVLVALYLAGVTALTAITAPVTGESPLAVAAATLLAAAAFQPVRRRIQRVVDRRFNRARYDAAVTVDQFKSRLRDDVDLASVTTSVRTAVDRSVQPARMLVWLRKEGLH